MDRFLQYFLSPAMFALLTMGGCLTVNAAGCTDSATHQFGYTEPAVEFSHGLFSGTKARASSNFNGHVELVLDPETNKITGLKADVTSNPIEVYDAQGRRIHENFLKGRELEYGFKVQAAQTIVSGIVDLAGTLVTLGTARGDPSITAAGLSLLDRVGPLLGGLGPSTGSGPGLDVAALIEALRGAATPSAGGTPAPQ